MEKQDCFIGSEAVDWICSQMNCTREEAVATGRWWEAIGDFAHVVKVFFFSSANGFD